MFKHEQTRGNIFKLLANLLADLAPLDAALGAGAIRERDVVHDLPERQARRQRLAAVTLVLG